MRCRSTIATYLTLTDTRSSYEENDPQTGGLPGWRSLGFFTGSNGSPTHGAEQRPQ